MTGRARRQQRKRARYRARIDALLAEFADEFRASLELDRGSFSRAAHYFEHLVFPKTDALFPPRVTRHF